MHNEFTAVFERDGDWVVAFCPEIPGANGQGRTKEEARKSLAAAFSNGKALPTPCGPTPRTARLKPFRGIREVPNILARKICRNLGIPEI